LNFLNWRFILVLFWVLIPVFLLILRNVLFEIKVSTQTVNADAHRI
jgi:hypothetical protein